MITKNLKIIFIFLALILLFLILKIGFTIFNEKTNIDLKTEEIKDIYIEYDNLINDSLSIINNFSYKDDYGYSCALKETFENNDNYNYYNKMILHICNIINSRGVLVIDDKLESIKYERLEPIFRNRFMHIKDMANMLYIENEQTIINDYIKSFSNLTNINNKSAYQESLNNNLINVYGKKYLYNDYKKVIEYEKEAIYVIHSILLQMEKDLTN